MKGVCVCGQAARAVWGDDFEHGFADQGTESGMGSSKECL